MDDRYGPLLFAEERSPEQREALRKQLERDPDLAKGWARWREVRAELRRRLQDRLPDRRLLVLYALEQDGHDDALTAREQEALDDARDDLAEAMEAIPALRRVVERIQDERAAFESAWSRHQATARDGATASERPSRRNRPERTSRRPSRSRRETADRRWAWRLTVAVLLVGAAVLAVFYGADNAARTTVTTQAGEQRVVEFEDGSTARLAGKAALSYTPGMATTSNRRVSLKRGRAYFDVVQRKGASFVVVTPTARAEVLGTQFGVTAGPETTEVVLVEGRVRLESGDGTGEGGVVLEPGEHSTVRRGSAPSSPTPADVTSSLKWTGLFVFRSTPTRAIARRLAEHYDVSITVAPSLADEPITGTFEREQSVSQVLRTLARTLGAELHVGDGAYRIEPGSS
ncbi:MAG: FecR domain-containing protein [Salinibacter sp.]